MTKDKQWFSDAGLTIMREEERISLSIADDDGRSLLAIHGNGTVTGSIEDASEAGAVLVAYLRQHLRDTPTNDERRVPGFADRERRAGQAWAEYHAGGKLMSHEFRAGYHRGVVDGVRCSEVPEPSAEDEFAPGECDGSGTCPAQRHIHGCYTVHRADQCDAPEEYGHLPSEPQGEPSDVRFHGIAGEVVSEAERSIAKHGEQRHLPMGTGADTRPLSARDVERGSMHDPGMWPGMTARHLARIATLDTKSHSANEGGDDTCTWWHILREEVFEAAAENRPDALRDELVQVAAVAVKMIDALDSGTTGGVR